MEPYDGKQAVCVILVGLFSICVTIGGVCTLLFLWYLIVGAGNAYDPVNDLLIVASVSASLAALFLWIIIKLNPVIHERPKGH